MKLYIGNKNYSSWSMRPWVLLTQSGVAFEEVKLRFDSFEDGSSFKRQVFEIGPTGRVPVLVDDDGLAIWDSLAICEYVAERFPDKHLWPEDPRQRARARSVCAEMHSGFLALRTHCPMNIEASMPEIGARVLREKNDVRSDFERIVALWSELLTEHRGPLLFGAFTIADAYFAPVVMRIRSYALPVPAAVATYIANIVELRSVAAWIRDAVAEKDFVAVEEPYRTGRGGTAPAERSGK
jgi:glutathione S-transferase